MRLLGRWYDTRGLRVKMFKSLKVKSPLSSGKLWESRCLRVRELLSIRIQMLVRKMALPNPEEIQSQGLHVAQ
jgi:hypothetical protein